MRTVFGYPVASETIVDEGPRVRRAVLAAAIGGVPLAFFRGANDPFNVPKLAFLVALVVVAGVVRVVELLQGASTKNLRLLLVPATAMLGPLFLSWLLSPYKGWALFGNYGRFQGLLPYVFVILLGILIGEAFAGHGRYLAWSVAAAAGIVGLYAVAQYAGIDLFNWSALGAQVKVTSTLGNPNFIGGFLGLTLPVAIGLALTEVERRNLALWIVGFVLGGLVVSFSQGGWAAAIAGCAVFAGSYLSTRYSWSKIAGVALAAIVAVAAVGIVLLEIVKPGAGPVSETAQLRSFWWQEAVAMGLDAPFAGHGPNAFAIDAYSYRIADDALTHGFDFSDDPHSVPLALFAAAGFLGLAGYLVVAGWGIRQGWGADASDLLRVGFAAAVVAYVVQSLVSIDELSLRMMFWVVLAGLASGSLVEETSGKARARRQDKKKARMGGLTRIRNLPGIGIAVVVLIAGIVWPLTWVVADAGVRDGVASLRGDDPLQGAEDLEAAISLRADNQYRHLLGFYLGRAALAAEAGGELLMERSIEAFDFLDGFPSVPALRDEANALYEFSLYKPRFGELSGDVYERVLPLDPLNTILVSEGIGVWVAIGHFQAAIDFLESADPRLFDVNPGLWISLALAYAEVGRTEEARIALDRAPTQDPADQTVARIVELIGDR